MIFQNATLLIKKINWLDVIVVLYGTLFIYAAVSKLLTYDEFKVQITKSPLLARQVWWIPWSIPGLEIAIGLMLFVPRMKMLALFSSFFLMFAFTVYIALMLIFLPNLPCSCGGILNSMGWTEHLIFNIIFTGLAVFGIALMNREQRNQTLAV